MGFLYGCLLDAKEEISLRFDHDRSRFQEVWNVFDKRWDNKLKTPLHRAGYYLNPYYYYSKKLDIELDGSFREGVVSCVTKMVDDIEVQDQIIAELEQYQDANGSFGKEIATRQRRNKDFDPAKWWMNHGTSAPNLRKLSIRILGLTCSSSACERNWSAFELVHTKKRNKLLHDSMKDLVFVKFNSKLKQKKDDKARDPIEKAFANLLLEDEANEWLTGIVPNAEPQPEAEQVGASSQGGAATQSKRKRGVQFIRKRKNIVPSLDDEVQSASSSESEDIDMQSLPSFDEEDDDKSISDSGDEEI